jgi:dipeptidyl aminopeptidase/acylaminoacyl peptidase
MNKSFAAILLGVLLAALLAISCKQTGENDEIVKFRGRDVYVKSFLTQFPYSPYGIKMSDDASKLFYLRSGKTSELVMLDLSTGSNLDQGKVISSEDFSKKSFWSHEYNETDGMLYWIGDERNDEIINLYRLNIETGEIEKLTDVPYIYGWSFNAGKTKVAYIARLAQNENRLDELHILDLETLEDTLVYTDEADFRMTWSEVSFSPDEKSVILTVLKDADRTYTNAACIDLEKGTLKVITDPSKEGSLDGTNMLSPWYDDNTAYYVSDQTGYPNIYSYNRKSGKTTRITTNESSLSVDWIEVDGRKYLFGIENNPAQTTVSIIDPLNGVVIASEHYQVTLGIKTTVANKAYLGAGATDIPFQLWAVTFDGKSLTKEIVVDLPQEKKDKMVASTTERVTIPTFDIDPKTGETRQLHAYILTPKNPLPEGEEIVMIQSFYGGDNSYDIEHQIFNAAGMYVLSPSPRGTSGFGRDFAALNDRDLGGNEIIDIIYCAQYISEKLGIPAERIGVFGMSHGGYATMRLLTFPGEVNGNKAFFPFGFGVAVAGFSDIIYEHNHSNIPDWTYLEAGDPEKDREKLIDRSPITHYEKITGPLLLIHGNHDDRVNIEGSRMMYNALKGIDKPVEFLEVDGQGHGFKGIDNNMLYYRTILNFIDKL